MRKALIFCLLGILVFVAQVQAAPQGSFTKNKSAVPFRDSVAVWNKAENKLIVAVFPSKLSSEEKKKIQNSDNIFSVLWEKASPDQSKWQWYPYTKFELSFKKDAKPTLENLTSIYILAYGVEKQNFTDNLNIGYDFKKYISKLNVNPSSKSFGLQMKGPYEIMESKYEMDLTVSDSLVVK